MNVLTGCKWINTVVMVVAAVYLFIVPGFLVLKDVQSPDIRTPGVPAQAWRIHRALSARFESWARERIASGAAAHLVLADVPSTEWPMFSCVFYLMATESLQAEWEKDHRLAPVAPREYAKGCIEAALDLAMDPVHHTWVKQHWGANYMHRENVFFRSLVIRAITSHEKLMKNGKHLDILRDQVLTLAADLDQSRFGVLDDYPGECYPIDVFAAIAWMKEAAELLGVDHSVFLTRAIRAFEGDLLDKRGLPLFVADAVRGKPVAEFAEERYRCSRGTGNSWVLSLAPGLWPATSATWYALYEKQCWQDKWWASGFREFPRDMAGLDYTFDIDSGPIIGGFSPAANAFGVAAARANGRFDHAYMLTAECLASCWPLADGTLLGPRILSSSSHAPYVGDAAICYFLTRQPAVGVPVVTGGHMPAFVYILVIVYYWGIGSAVTVSVVAGMRRWLCDRSAATAPAVGLQVAVWCGFWVAGLIAACLGHIGAGILSILLAQFLPYGRHVG